MNRIILTGNGFDLAHGLETSYKHFIDNFWAIKAKVCAGEQRFHDEEGDVEFISETKKLIDFYTLQELSNCKDFTELQTFVNKNNTSINFKNTFLEEITTKCELNSWVDVEKEYYSALLKCKNDHYKQFSINEDIDDLNKNFERIKNLLKVYLNGISQKYIDATLLKRDILENISTQPRYRELSQSYKNILLKDLLDTANPRFEYEKKDETYELIKYYFEHVHKIENESDITRKDLEVILNDTTKAPSIIQDLSLKNILFLNFNYTDTHTIYINKIKSINSYEIGVKDISIHGTLEDAENPMIFGFGDEIDDNYSKIENLDDNRYLENIKSTKYHETDNYKRLLEYIDNDYFQVFIFGHSCGLSDRTLLSTLFNHKNCISIKPYYHKRYDGTDNYSDIVKNISRHFKDKSSLRDKVVNKTYCRPLIGSK